MLITVLIALLSSGLWGTSDFLGGIAARRATVLATTAWAYVGATLVMIVVVLTTSGTWSSAMIAAASVAGVTNVLGLLAFYAAFATAAMGPMGAIVGASQAVVPVFVAVVWHGESISSPAWAGIAIAILGSVLIGMAEGSSGGRTALRPIAFAILAGVLFGSTIAALGSAPVDAGMLTPTIEMVIGLVLVGLLVLLVRHSPRVDDAMQTLGITSGDRRPPRQATAIAVAGGVVLASANIAEIIALQKGSLAAVGVVISLYPITTAVLARVFLKERLRPMHVVGIAAALGGCAVLAMS